MDEDSGMEHSASDATGTEEQRVEYTRRDALNAMRRYSAVLAGSATIVLTADEVLAKPNCSRIFGNGNGPPPGKGPPACR